MFTTARLIAFSALWLLMLLSAAWMAPTLAQTPPLPLYANCQTLTPSPVLTLHSIFKTATAQASITPTAVPATLPATATPRPAAGTPTQEVWQNYRVNVGNVNVRNAPNTAASVVGSVMYGTVVVVLEIRDVAGYKWGRLAGERWVAIVTNTGQALLIAIP